MTEETKHEGLPVHGYVAQTDAKVALVNENKVLEERVLRQIDNMSRTNRMVAGDGEAVMLYDARMIAIARTGIQEAFMWLNRAVFQPARVRLPEDDNPDAASPTYEQDVLAKRAARGELRPSDGGDVKPSDGA